MTRNLGLLAVIATLVGYVIGASIFILPGSLAGSAGPAVVVSYMLAAIIAAFSCVAAAQLGVVFPRVGAGYVAISRLLSPFAGFIGIWLMLAVFVLAIVLIALGFAEYFVALVPGANALLVAALVIVLFTLLNLGGAGLMVRVQGLLVLGFMLALVLVIGVGLGEAEPANLRPFAPAGWYPVIFAAVPAFFSYGGFMAVMELAGEIRDPARTIPRALAISFVLVVVTYVALALTLVGVMPWQTLGATAAPVRVVALDLFGSVGGLLVTLAILGAAATSVNALLLVASRDIYAMAADGCLPRWLVANGSTGRSVLLAGLLSLLCLGLGETVIGYAVWVSAFTLIFQVLVGIALLRLYTHSTEFDNAPLRLGPRSMLFVGWGLILVSGFFLAFVAQDSLTRTTGALVYLALGCAVFWRRSRVRSPALEVTDVHSTP
ncbi:amino acid permease [Haliea sp. E1-2-M8]|uniref:APC family permease n=1 Tax=Haliea sp. E1-2-M8 TaxID=3064706 RepID=UPI00271E4801|nr:amino acid permease [Haliea sp. E1-2-M8]MDO8861177.1 amino acid permease [Haliea sp. E1-2-M8]